MSRASQVQDFMSCNTNQALNHHSNYGQTKDLQTQVHENVLKT